VFEQLQRSVKRRPPVVRVGLRGIARGSPSASLVEAESAADVMGFPFFTELEIA